MNLGINSIVPFEFRLKSEDIEVAEASQQWIPPGIKRPEMKTNNIKQTFDGKIEIPFPVPFDVPEDWRSLFSFSNSKTRLLQT